MSTEKKDTVTSGPGEGNREADARYRAGATRHAKEADVEGEAKEAVRALEESGGELAEAERDGKKHAAEEDPELYRFGKPA